MRLHKEKRKKKNVVERGDLVKSFDIVVEAIYFVLYACFHSTDVMIR